ncbi:hypothetical protein CEUSTIGMA_g12818.t1 [Chlamydomonas eustigma]|uniref:Guanylate cyclase domain-containing protein n=1 Tax=Chlamydomonas eustigma TaxID=1157962 RepID=A0A250XR32_9CHLO|nr:hypothetical protein CEUSTIGMA_g12818.t1 [Chlamydomonas eustigma]|eukprot:GAX85402.1 hypothetical protein CEUSTIGMA_g12818.t1 [Chlamydomonas eustigma]
MDYLRGVIGSGLQTRSLSLAFLTRLVIFRSLLVAIGIMEMDRSLSALLTFSEYGVMQRVVLISLLLPIAFNTVGLVWPILHIDTFEANFKVFQRSVVAVTVVTRLFQAASAQAWLPTRSVHQNLIFDAFMLIINQDGIEELLLQLAFIQFMYSASTLLSSDNATQRSSTSSASHLEAMTQCEFFVMILMLAIPMHKLYGKVMGPRDKTGILREKMKLLHSNRTQGRVSGVPHLASIFSQLYSWISSLRLCKQAVQKSTMQGRYVEGHVQLSAAYISKLVTVKGMHCAHFLLLFLRLIATSTSHSFESTPASWSSQGTCQDATQEIEGLKLQSSALAEMHVPSRNDLMAAISCFAALSLGTHAMLAAFGSSFYLKRYNLVDRTSLVLCGASRVLLILLDCAGSALYNSSNQVTFHNLLVVSFSLVAHEDLYPSFLLLLAGLTLVFKVLSAHLDDHPLSVKNFIFDHPEYYVLYGFVALAYPMTRVGKKLQDQGNSAFGLEDLGGGMEPLKSPSHLLRHLSTMTSLRRSIDVSRSVSGPESSHRERIAIKGTKDTEEVDLKMCLHDLILESDAEDVKTGTPKSSLVLWSLQDTNAEMDSGIGSRKKPVSRRSLKSCTTRDLNVRKVDNQLLSKDRMFILVELPLCTYLALLPIRRALLLAVSSSAWICALPAIMYWLACLIHALAIASYPVPTMRRRNLLWALRLDVALALLQVSNTMLLIRDGDAAAQLPPLRVLMLLSAKWGLLNLGDQLFFKTLPIKVSIFLLLEFYHTSHNHDWFQLLADVVMFHMWAGLTYASLRLTVLAARKLTNRMLGKSPELKGTSLYAYVAGHGLAAIAVMSQSVPSLVELQNQVWRSLLDQLSSLGFGMSFNSATGSFITVLAIVALFFGINALQSAALKIATLLDPEQQWYQKQQLRVAEFMEIMMHGHDHSLDSIVVALMDTTQSMFAENMLVKIAFLELDSNQEASLARLQIIHWGYKHVRDGLQDRTMPLSLLPSIAHATKEKVSLLTNDYDSAIPNLQFADWELQRQTYGARSFLAVPLVCSGRGLGALVFMSTDVNAISVQMQRVVSELGVQVAQSLYLRICRHKLAAGEKLITDMIPEHVAESLKRKLKGLHTGAQPRAALTPRSSSLVTPLSRALTQDSIQVNSIAGEDVKLTEQMDPDGVAENNEKALSPQNEVQLVYQQWHPAVTILFADIVGFTTLSKEVEPEQVMYMLHDLFTRFDAMCIARGIYKVETIGDCYMASSGLIVETDDHALQMVEFAKGMLEAAKAVKNPTGGTVQIRIGIHSGRVMSGIVGSLRAHYGLFGDTVNTASRMESTSLPMQIQLSEATYSLLPAETQESCSLRGQIEVKGKGIMSTYLVDPHITE